MKKFMYLFLALLFSYYCFSQWQTFQTPTNIRFQEVCVVDQNIIWACGSNGTVVKTTNSGTNWSVYTVYQTSHMIYHISAIDNNTAWITGDSAAAKIYRTINGGINWTEQPYRQPYFINNIHFFNSNTGIFLRDPLNPPSNDTAGFLITRNGGINWYRSPNTPRTTILNDNCMFALDTNFVCFTDNNYLYKLTGGLDNVWQKLPITPGTYANNSYFLNSQTGYVADWSFKLFKTTNGGLNWSVISTDSHFPYFEFLFIPNTNLGFIAGSDEIRVSTNSGVTWDMRVTYSNADSVYLGYMDAYDSSSVWLACNKGRLLKYNINYIGIEPVISEAPQKFALHQNYPNPFNPLTKIRFDIPVYSEFSIIVFDVTGKEVYGVKSIKDKGSYVLTFDGSSLSSGVYFYRLKADKFFEVKKMIIMK